MRAHSIMTRSTSRSDLGGDRDTCIATLCYIVASAWMRALVRSCPLSDQSPFGIGAVVADIVDAPASEHGQRLDRRCRYFRERAIELGMAEAIANAMAEDLAEALRKRLVARFA
jgi:hypothetical protein